MSRRASIRRGVGVALFVGGIGLVAIGLLARSSVGGRAEEVRAAATVLRGRIDQSLAAATRAIEPQAIAAAHLPEIVSGLDLEADPHTFQDLLQTEDWWAPYRNRFELSGIVTSSGSLATLGLVGADLSNTELVRQARDLGAASGVVTHAGAPFLMGAARVPPGKRPVSGAVVVLGAPLDRAALERMAEASAAPVGVSDGKRLLAAANPLAAGPAGGPNQPGGWAAADVPFREVVGREQRALAEGTLAAGEQTAIAWPLVVAAADPSTAPPKLWLLALLADAPPPDPPVIAIAILSFGLLLSVAGLTLRLRAGGGPSPDFQSVGLAADDAELTGDFTPAGLGGPERLPARRSQPIPTLGSDPGVPGGHPRRGTPPAGSGMMLGRYRLLERIGEGGMAEIFIAAAHGAEGFVRHFVLKRMHPHLARSGDAVRQFIDEARLQSGLVHSNIVPVFDFGHAGDEYFMALEYIHGRPLQRLVRRHIEVHGRPLSLPVAFFVLHEVLEALAYAHTRTDGDGRPLGIVHRDVSPNNVLISERGEVKLSDFGIAKSADRESQTEIGLIKGNVSFMSPEQARGEPVDERSDLFSTAVVLYFCLTGQLLYSDETMFNRLIRAAAGPAGTVFGQLDQLSPVAADVLRKGLSLDAARRYQTAREFARELAVHFNAGRAELADLMESLFPELKRERV